MDLDFSHAQKLEVEVPFLEIQAQAELFDDLDFTPSVESLYDPESTKLTGDTLDRWNDIEWRRASQIFEGKDYRVFYKGITPNDILQGSLGNCYFLSAIAAIAEFPQRIEEIFQTDYKNDAGCYAVRMCVNGEFKNIVVDDHFPCWKGTLTPCFSQSKGYELWVLLIEKAWAKINRNYESTVAGFCSEALRALTGAPCYLINNKDSEDMWDQVIHADKNNFIICASAAMEDMTDQEFMNMGLISNHAYTVISAVEVTTDDGVVRLLKLRNPWGHQEWSGDWSDNSDKWTPQLRQLLKLDVKDDGIFWMCLEDYIQYYNTTTICKMRENFNMQSLRLSHPKGGSCACLIKLRKPTKIYFTASQYRWRMLPRNQNYKASFIKMILCRLGDSFSYQKYEYLDARVTRAEDTTIEAEEGLEPGRYIVWMQTEWEFDGVETIFFNTYSDNAVQLSPMDIDPHQFLPQVLQSCALQKTKPKNYEAQGDSNILRYMSISDSKCEYGYVLYHNKSHEGNTLFELLQFTKLENYIEFESGVTPKEIPVRIHPGEMKMFVMKRTQRSAKYSYTHYSILRQSDKALDARIEEAKVDRKQVVYKKQPIDVYYLAYPYEVGYMWKFWNETDDQRFEGTFTFEFTNMEIEDEPESESFKISLEPGETALKSIVVKNLSEGYCYKNNFSFKCRKGAGLSLKIL